MSDDIGDRINTRLDATTGGYFSASDYDGSHIRLKCSGGGEWLADAHAAHRVLRALGQRLSATTEDAQVLLDALASGGARPLGPAWR